MKRSTILLFAAVYLLATPACFAQRPADVSRIRGGAHTGNARGSLSVLTLERPDGQLLVAVQYPQPIDTTWYPGYGHSGNGDDVTNWEKLYKIRFKEKNEFVEWIVHWKYSSRTRKLWFGDRTFDLPPNKLAVLSYDQDRAPVCTLRDDTPAERERIGKEFGAARILAKPAAPAP